MLMIMLTAMLAVTGLVARPAAAQDEPDPAPAPVRLDGRTIFRVGGNEEMSAADRAARVEGRLAALLESPEAIAPAVIERRGPEERIISVAGAPIVTVTTADAEDNVTELDELATEWAAIIDTALANAVGRRETGRWSAVVLIDGAFARLLESVRLILPRALAAVLVLTLFGLIATAVRWLLRALFGRYEYDATLRNLLMQLIYYGLWVLGIIVAVSAMGFDPQALATAIGLTSVALGFAMKDVLSNFVSGLLLLIMRPFKIGDQIIVGPTEGVVERIELRATRIHTYDGRVVLVPNAELFTSRVTNNTASPIRRDSVVVYLAYDADLATASAVALESMRATVGVLEEPPPSILVRDLGATAIGVELRFWTDSRRADFLATRSRVNTAVVAALREASVGLPEPGATTVVVSGE